MKQAWNLAGVFLLLASITAMSAGETAEIYALSDSYKLNKEGTKIWSLATLDLAALKKKSRIWDGATSTISLAAARRETVAFQIILQAGDGGATDVDVVVEDLKGPQGAIAATQIHLFKEWYVKTASTSSENCNPSTGVGWYPDALVPWDVKDHGAFDGAPFAIEKNMAQAVWVDIDVPAGIPAGDYQGRVIVRKFFVKQPGANPEGDQLSAGTPLNLRVRVRDLELPRETHHLLFGNGAAADIWSAGGASLKDKPEQKAKYEEEMFRMARKHRITLGNMYYEGYHDQNSVLPKIKMDKDGNIVDVDWSLYDARFGKFLSPKDNAFGAGEPPIEYWRLPMGTAITKKKFPTEDRAFEQFPQWIQKHWKEKGWNIDQAYVYLADEPQIDELPKLAEIAKKIGAATKPPLHMQIAILAAKDAEKITAEYQRLFPGLLDRWMWSANSIDLAMMRKKLQSTDWIGFYQGNEPYCPVHVLDKDGLALRAWSWIAWQYQIRFSCYFSLTECSVLLKEDDYSNVAKQANLIWTEPKNRPNGNQCKAVCFYPGNFVGSDLPIANIRLKELRRGQQDYEYMWMLADKGQKETVDADVKAIVRKALTEAADGPNLIGTKAGAWETDPEKWDATIAKWGDMLEKPAAPAAK